MIFNQVFIAIINLSPGYCSTSYGLGWPCDAFEGHGIHGQANIAPDNKYSAYCEDFYCSDLYPALNVDLTYRNFQYEQAGAQEIIHAQYGLETKHEIGSQAYEVIETDFSLENQYISDKITSKNSQIIFEINDFIDLKNQGILNVSSSYYNNNQADFNIANIYSLENQAGFIKEHFISNQTSLNISEGKYFSSQGIFTLSVESFFNNQANLYRYEERKEQGLFSILNTDSFFDSQIEASILSSHEMSYQGSFNPSQEHEISSQIDFEISIGKYFCAQANLYRYEERKSQGDFNIQESKGLQNQFISDKLSFFNNQFISSIKEEREFSNQTTFSSSATKTFYSQGTFEINTPFFFGYCLDDYCSKDYCSYVGPQNERYFLSQVDFEVNQIHEVSSQANLYRYEERKSQANFEAIGSYEIANQAVLYRYEERKAQTDFSISSTHEIASQSEVAILEEKILENQGDFSVSSSHEIAAQGDFAVLDAHEIASQLNLYRYEERKNQIDFSISQGKFLNNQYNSDLIRSFDSQATIEILSLRDLNVQSDFAIKDSHEINTSSIFTISNMYYIGYCSNDYCSNDYCSENILVGGFKNNFQADFSILKSHDLSSQANLYRYEERKYQGSFNVKTSTIYFMQSNFMRYEFRHNQYEPSILAFKYCYSQYGLESQHEISNMFISKVNGDVAIPSQMYFSSPYLVFGDKDGYASSPWPSKLWAYTNTIAWRVLTQATFRITRQEEVQNQASVYISYPHDLKTQYFFKTDKLKYVGQQCFVYRAIIKRFIHMNRCSFLVVVPKRVQMQLKRRPF